LGRRPVRQTCAMVVQPKLVAEKRSAISILTDPSARAEGLLVAFTDRRGGVSRAPYAELNLAARVGDDVDLVTENRRRAARAIGYEASSLALSRQVHGRELIKVRPDQSGVLGEADGLVLSEPGPVVGILTADCAPVVVAGNGSAAVLHGGWRGLVAGVVEAGVEAIGEGTTAWIGPAIKSCCYEVGAEVIASFDESGLPVAERSGERGRVDIADAARASLERAGVARIIDSGVCTHCNEDYYSYRRDGVTGRQGAFLSLLAQ
jgi:YfiH family protein